METGIYLLLRIIITNLPTLSSYTNNKNNLDNMIGFLVLLFRLVIICNLRCVEIFYLFLGTTNLMFYSPIRRIMQLLISTYTVDPFESY